MFTGHVVMLPCLYLLVNFIAVGFQLLVEAVLYMFVYGMSGHGGSAGRLALPAGAVHAAHKCRSRRSGASDQRHGGGGCHCQLLRLDLSARLGGVRAAAARMRGAALPAPPHGERGRHRRHPGAQAGAEVHRGALRRSGNAGRRIRHAAQRTGLPGTSGAVPAAGSPRRGARLCHQRDGHPQVPAHPAHGLARLRGHSGRVLPRRWSARSATSRATPLPHPDDTAQVKSASSATVTAPRSPRRRTFRPWRTSTAPSWRSAKRSRTTPASPVCS